MRIRVLLAPADAIDERKGTTVCFFGMRAFLLVVTLTCLSGCAAVGLGLLISPPIPVNYYVFDPQADWGKRARLGGCPAGTDVIRVKAKNPQWVTIYFGIWDAKHAGSYDFKDPVLFINIKKSWTFFIHEQEARTKTPVTVQGVTSQVLISLPDATQRTFEVPGLNEELVIAGPRVNNGLGWGKVYEVPLHGIQGQDLVAYFPDLLVNGERINAGAVSFTHRKETRYGGC